MEEEPAGRAGERKRSVAGHAIPHTRAHTHIHQHAHTHTQIDSRSFASKKLLTVNRVAKTWCVEIWWDSSRACLRILHKQSKKLLLYKRELVRVYTDRRAARYKHPCRRRRFLCSNLSTRRMGTSLTYSQARRDEPLIDPLIRSTDRR